MKQIRKRLTYANVMASIAMFLVLGGATAFAALKKNSVSSKQLKNNAVTTKKIKNGAVTTAKLKNGAVTGAKVNLGSLGKVPSAANADHAGVADSLSSPLVRPFKFFSNNGTATILAVTGATFEGVCENGELSETETVIKATANNGIAKVEGVDEGDEAFNNSADDFDTGETLELLNIAGISAEVGATADFMGAGGNPNVSVNYASEEGEENGPGAECLIWGTAQTP